MKGSFQKGSYGYYRPLVERFSVTDKDMRMSYRIRDRGDGRMSIEPYRSHLNHMWYFHTAPLAQHSADELWNRFLDYHWHGDFIGMDMACKFVEMGMMCSQYMEDLRRGKVRDAEDAPREINSARTRAMLTSEVALIYREVFEDMRRHRGYVKHREEFLAEQRVWERKFKRNAERGFKRVACPRPGDQVVEPKKLECQDERGQSTVSVPGQDQPTLKQRNIGD
jgi:hypothetical protein